MWGGGGGGGQQGQEKNRWKRTGMKASAGTALQQILQNFILYCGAQIPGTWTKLKYQKCSVSVRWTFKGECDGFFLSGQKQKSTNGYIRQTLHGKISRMMLMLSGAPEHFD